MSVLGYHALKTKADEWETETGGDGIKRALLYHYYYCDFMRFVINQSINESIDQFWVCCRRGREGIRCDYMDVARLKPAGGRGDV